MSKPWVFTPSDKPPVLVYGAFVKSVVVLILMKIVTIVSTFISTFIDRNSEIGPNLRLSRPSTEPSGICISFLPPRRREPKSSKRGSDSDSARSSPRPYAPTSRIGFPRRPAAGGRRQTVPRRSPIRGPLA